MRPPPPTTTIPVNKQYNALVGPTNMTQDFAPKCTLYCFLTGMVGGGVGGVPASGPHGSWLAAGRLGEGVFINREQ